MAKDSTIKQSKSGGDDWYGQEANVQSGPLVDSGTGIPVIMRFFEFKANPVNLKRDKPTKQDLFNSHYHQIKTTLWADGLKVLEGIEPAIILSKRKDSYRIMVTCIPKEGVSLLESTQTLQQLIKT